MLYGFLLLIAGLLPLPLSFVIDPTRGLSQWLDTWGNPRIPVNDAGDGLIILAFAVTTVAYIIGFRLVLPAHKLDNKVQTFLAFLGGVVIYYVLISMMMSLVVHWNW